MAKTLQFRRGTTAELSSVTGAVGELFVDTEKNTLLVHDGTTGHELVAQDGDATLNSALIGDVSIIGNTVSGVDSYGNPDTLVVEGDLTVKYDTTAVTSQQLVNNTNSAFWSPTTYGSGIIYFSNQSPGVGWPLSDLNTLDAIEPGTVVQFAFSTNYGASFGNFTVVSSSQSVDYYGQTILSFEITNINVTGGTSMWVGANPIEMSYFDLSWSATTGSSVDVLEVTSAGVNVNGTFTVNGQPVGSGGSSYDQSLNTTDDVVFNSALVGDVSVAGNTISGVDSYGNPDILVVEGDLTVRYDSQVTTSASLLNAYTNATYCYFNAAYGGGTFQFSNSNNNGWPEQDLNTLAAIQPGTVVNFTDLNTSYGNSTGSFIVVSAALSTYYGSPILNMTVSDISVTSGSTAWLSGSSISNINWAWSATTGSMVDVLDVTNAGVDITGTLTVNGQAIAAGASYDQSLNTTDDVTFNSALVGDVSIVGNTIAGIDSYGNADTLVVDGDLEVTGALINDATLTLNVDGSKSIVVGSQTVVTNTVNVNIVDSISWYYDMMSNKSYIRTMGSSYDQFFKAGMVVTGYQDVGGTPGPAITFTLATDMVYNPTVNANAAETVEDLRQWPYYMNSQVYFYNVITTSLTTGSFTNYDFDDQGTFTTPDLVVTGNLTVNGQSVAAFDQDLNTTDDVVFNSALVGDVSIVGNTIAGVDSYGNPDTLIVDGDLNVQHTVETVTVLSGLSYDDALFEPTPNPVAGGQVHFQDYGNLNSNTESTLLALTAGQQITLIDNTSVSRTYTVVGTATQVGMGGTDVLVYVQELWSEYVAFPPNGNITVATTTTTNSLSVTDSAVVVDGNLVPATDMAYSLGSPTKQWKDLYVSTNTIYIGGTPITVEGGELKVDGVSLIESNYVGSKAITAVAPIVTTSTWSDVFWFEAVAAMSQRTPSPTPSLQFTIFSGQVSPEFINTLLSLQAGDAIEHNGGQFTLDGAFVNYGEGGNYALEAPLQTQTGIIDLYVFSGSINIIKNSEQSASFSFAADGNFAAPSVLADSALIGDVSITGNTIAGVDSYGLASDLILEGTVVYASETSETPVTPGSVNKWLKVGAQVPSTILVVSEYDSINWMNGATYNSATQTLSFDGITGTFQTVLQSLSVGDTLRIYVPTYGSWFTLSLSSQFTEQGSPGPWTASVNEDVFGTPDTASITLVEISLPSNTGPLETQYFYMPLYK